MCHNFSHEKKRKKCHNFPNHKQRGKVWGRKSNFHVTVSWLFRTWLLFSTELKLRQKSAIRQPYDFFLNHNFVVIPIKNLRKQTLYEDVFMWCGVIYVYLRLVSPWCLPHYSVSPLDQATKKHLTQRIQNVDGKLDDQMEMSKLLRNEVQIYSNTSLSLFMFGVCFLWSTVIILKFILSWLYYNFAV